MPQINKTYIEKPEYWETNRVAVVRGVKGDNVHCTIINLDNWQTSPARISLNDFKRRYELCEIQMSV